MAWSKTNPHPLEPAPAHLPAENGVHVWRAAVIMPFITFSFVAMRFYTCKFLLKRKFALDDYICAVTMIVIIAHAVLMAEATYNGMGLHIWQYTPELNGRYYKWIGISSQFYVLGLIGFKSSLVLLYVRLFGAASRRFRFICYGVLFYTIGYLFCNLVTEFAGCWPTAKKWLPATEGRCINSIAANIAYGAGHMSSDLFIGILPLPVIWRLQFPSVRQKIGLSLALTSGFLAWAVACARWGISTYNMLSYDRPWWAGISFTLSILEVNLGLICACTATYSPLLTRFYTQLKDWSSKRSSRRTARANSEVVLKDYNPGSDSHKLHFKDQNWGGGNGNGMGVSVTIGTSSLHSTRWPPSSTPADNLSWSERVKGAKDGRGWSSKAGWRDRDAEAEIGLALSSEWAPAVPAVSAHQNLPRDSFDSLECPLETVESRR